MADDAGSGSWWKTLPGVLTAVAGLITAAAGLLVALHQTGLLNARSAAPPVDEPGRIAGASAPPTTPRGASAAGTVPAGMVPAGATPPSGVASTSPSRGGFPHPLAVVGQQVRISTAIYRVLAADVDRSAPGELELRLVVRANNVAGTNFLAVDPNTFRLLADGVPLAPDDAGTTFNTYVAPGSAQQGNVVFVFSDSTRAVQLLFRGPYGEGQRTIPVDLAARAAVP